MEKRVLILSDSFPPESLGGADRVAFWQARELLKHGFEVLVVTTTRDKEKEESYFYEGVWVKRIYSKYHERWRAYVSLYNPRVVYRVKKIIEDFKPDIVHAHNIHFYLSYACLKVAKKFGAKVFITAHDAMMVTYGKLRTEKYLKYGDTRISWRDNLKQAGKRFNPFRDIVIKYYLNWVDKILVVSEALAEALKVNGISKLMIFHNGIDVNEWIINDELIKNFKEKYELNNSKVILFGGRLSEGKGGKIMLEVLSNLVKIDNNIKLLILGRKDDYLRLMEGVIKKINIEENIIFTGWIEGDDLKSAYWSSDVVCVPSIYLDPFPTVNLEAMACGKPVVGTCFGGIKEVVVHNDTGYIVDPFDIKKMLYYLNELLSDNKKAVQFGDMGYIRVKNKFSKEKWVDALIDYYV